MKKKVKLFEEIMEYWRERALVELFYKEEEIERRGIDILLVEIKENLKNELKEVLDSEREYLIYDWADKHVPVYNYDILEWYLKDLQRLEYPDKALNEFKGGEENIISILQRGVYLFLVEFGEMVLERLRKEEKKGGGENE